MKVNAIMEQLDESDGNVHGSKTNINHFIPFLNNSMRKALRTGRNLRLKGKIKDIKTGGTKNIKITLKI